MANVVKYTSPMDRMGNGTYIRPSFFVRKNLALMKEKDETHPADCFTEKSSSLTPDGIFY